MLAPGDYQQLLQGQAAFAHDLNVYAAHYPTDVIGGRILGIYVVAQTLSGNPLYPQGTATPGNLAALSQAMQSYLGGGGSSVYAAACAGNVAACVANGTIPSAASYAQQSQNYTNFLTFGLPSVGDTTLSPIVPAGAAALIATRFPYLSAAQLNQVLATTELPSGGPIDNGTGWARLNLYAAASGYGAFPSNVAVSMNAALGGLDAFDVWSNAISGPGGLTLQGSGILILAGNNTYTGGTSVQGGTLAVTGTLGGNLTIAAGATFVGNGGYAVAGNASLANAGTLIEVNTPLINAGIASNTGTIVGDVTNSGSFNNNAVVNGALQQCGAALRQRRRRLAGPAPRLGDRARQFDRHHAGHRQSHCRTGCRLPGAGRDQRRRPDPGRRHRQPVRRHRHRNPIGAGPALGSSFPILTAAGGVIRQLQFIDRTDERSRRRHAVRHAVRRQRDLTGGDTEPLRQPRRRGRG